MKHIISKQSVNLSYLLEDSVKLEKTITSLQNIALNVHWLNESSDSLKHQSNIFTENISSINRKLVDLEKYVSTFISEDYKIFHLFFSR